MSSNAELLKELRIDRGAPPPREPRRGLLIGLGVGAAVLLAVLAAWFLLTRGDVPQVRTATATAIGGQAGAAASVLDATGYVVARRMATVSAKITGRVREVLIEEGQRVEEGQVMARLDPVDADAQRALATQQLGAARANADATRARLREAEANATRLGGLVGQQLVSQAQYDQALAERDALRAQLASMGRQAGVAADQLHIAELGVDNTIVRAPFAGVVTAKAAQPGEIVSPMATGGFTRTGIGTIVDMESLEVEVDVGESYIGRVEPGMPVEATLNAYPDWRIPAHVIAIIPTADRGKATVKVRIGLDQQDPRIVPEMGVRVSFLERAPEPGEGNDAGPAVLVPGAAIARRNNTPVAFVLTGRDGDSARVEQRTIEPGRTLGGDREVTSGLAGGETVVLSPPDELEDGSEVRIAPAQD
ncbi:efflux RND transporter periplasmic adaptor subunit [Lysobacter sp. GX 14042]|uniref:efflux RND transporter periplasmic adaptor subunit n=1 Tax=Lysobacter sp. GX 14042 TaxID=2907155 RepID=UPI001F355A86|nr:efflux RND transporter periplasmic adaptor subunit [Lysobacter sp. GX 14042]MCE7032044.1 efflux RND transporter periplasmic adaptor subunit [Lysobacter sp. GX 14042]